MKTLPHWSRFTIAKEKRMTTYEHLNLTIAFLSLLASYGGLALIYYGIRVMAKGAETRAADSERKHEQVMTASERRHDEAMASLRELIDGQAESRMALRQLIERTG